MINLGMCLEIKQSGQPFYLDEKDYKVAHRYVLTNYETLQQYESVFEDQMTIKHGCQSPTDFWNRFEAEYSEWFRKYVREKGVNDDIICSLASGPLTRVRKYNQYHINGYNFHTLSYGKSKSTMNYGVCVKEIQGNHYYGILLEVIELFYVGAKKNYTAVLFKCDWYDVGRGTRIHDKYNIVEINHTKSYPKYVMSYYVWF